MTNPDITLSAPFFIVRNVPAALSFYRDRLGFDITFRGLRAKRVIWRMARPARLRD